MLTLHLLITTYSAQHRIIEKKNNLMYIQKGTTVINIKVPYVWQGAIVSIAGIILSVVWVIALGKTGKSGKNKNENI